MKYLNQIIDWHRNLVFRVQDSMRIDDYWLYWISFAKGLVLATLIAWII
jgi:hypothetical protein|tara:strand:+ start:165 stop:311 length:147 start_codon:yes stop_codon:yes gene_type:complete